MTQVSVVAPAGGDVIQLGPVQMRILEDGRTSDHRLGIGNRCLSTIHQSCKKQPENIVVEVHPVQIFRIVRLTWAYRQLTASIAVTDVLDDRPGRG